MTYEKTITCPYCAEDYIHGYDEAVEDTTLKCPYCDRKHRYTLEVPESGKSGSEES